MATYYWVGGSGTWNNASTTNWSTTSGGAGGAGYPLATDNVIFDSNSSATSYTVTKATVAYCLGWTAAGPASGSVTFAGTSTTCRIYGAVSFAATGVVYSCTGSTLLVAGSTTVTIATNGVVITDIWTFGGSGTGGWVLGSSLTISNTSAGACTFSNGNLDLNGYTLTLSATTTTASFLINGSNNKNLTFNGGTLSIASASAAAFNNLAGAGIFTTTAGTGTGVINMTSASAKGFQGGGGFVYNCTINQGGAGALTLSSGGDTFLNITNTVQPAQVIFAVASVNTFSAFNLSGVSGSLITVKCNSIGTQTTISKSSGIVSCDYLSIQDIAATGGATWYAGAHSTNVSDNTGWIFTAPPTTNSGNFLMLF